MHKRIRFFVFLTGVLASFTCVSQQKKHPNVIIIMTDDQGYGDLGITGNPHVQTPVIDAFGKKNIRFNNFYVSPVCAPTRSSLMTGRYSLRTGISDTYNGGAIMAGNEVTIAEMLKQANYKTGIFGKWHLGDNYPSRPSDQGFDESLIHLAGGMGQPGDFTTFFQGGRSYFDPVLWHNNQKQSYQGYCSDIFAENAIDFIEENKEGPFFCYLAFNAPHTPLQVPAAYYQKYKDLDPSKGFEKNKGVAIEMSEKDKEAARKVYAMVSNIDDNIGKLLAKLDALKISDHTLVIFMTDNGPQHVRYVGGMRGRKGSVYQGGVRVPFYMRYPRLTKKAKDINTQTAHIDILPTLSELCEVPLPENKKIDGKSWMPLLKKKKVDWADRSLFFYWTRRYPELYNNISYHQEGYKLVGLTDYDAKIEDFELYHIQEDPFELNNLITKEKEIANQLKKGLDARYQELIQSENLIHPQPIYIGTPYENPIVLNRNDAGGARAIWKQEEVYGKWFVNITPGKYNIKCKFIKPIEKGGTLFLETQGVIHKKKNALENTDVLEMKNVSLSVMEGDLIPFYTIKGKRIFPFWVALEKINTK